MSEKIPKGWKWVKLGEVVTLQRGYDLPKTKMKKGDIPVVGSNGIIGYHNKATTKAPGITIGRSGNIGNAYLHKSDFWAHNTTLYVKDFKGNDVIFLFYLFKNIDFNQLNAGSAVPTLNRNHIYPIEVKIPIRIEDQKAIAEVLSSIDDKIDLLHRQNKTLEEMAMTLFRQWFIEPTKDGLPEGWEEVSLGEIIEISSGKSIEKGKLKEKGLYPVLGANGEIGRTDDWLYEGELIYTGRVGTLGNVFIVFRNEKVWLTDNTLVIKPNKNEYFYFVYFTLKNAKLDEYNSGSTQPLIRQSDIKKIEIFLPKINFLKDFEVISRNLFTKIQFNTSQIQTLDKLRDTLLPKLMSGELRVKV